ncbi:MAG: glutathione S-transferase N-terminal domain-containing protein [Bdellovibrionota bacterium]
MVLYTFGTPNGHKVQIALEEMGLIYETKSIDIMKGENKKPEFSKVNPNGKIPALQDDDGTLIFESVAILIYLAEKTGKFLPASGPARAHVLSWAIWQTSGLGPMMGQYGHFTRYAPEKIPYAIKRYEDESMRLLQVMETQLETNKYLAGDEYSIADMASWPWIRGVQFFYKVTIDPHQFPNVHRWYADIAERPAVKRALT